MEDPGLFDRQAAVYERARLPYPPALYAHLRHRGVLRGGLRVLEVGAGTGQATGQFVSEGADVTAVEPGLALARRLRLHWPQVSILNSRLEDSTLSPGGFDVVVCATALHWLDLPIALPKLYTALAPGGTLAVWWTVFGDPLVDTPFRRAVSAITARRTAPQRKHPSALDTRYWTAALTSHAPFDNVRVDTFRWSVELTSVRARELFSTFTDWAPDELAELAQVVDELGGRITDHYVTVLYEAQPSAGARREHRGHMR